MRTKISSNSSTSWVIVAVVAMLMAVVISCDSKDEPSDDVVPVVEQSEAVLGSESVSDSKDTAQNDPELAGVVVVPAIEPEPGSEEEAIFEVLDSIGRALRAMDWNLYLAACNPERDMFSFEQIKFLGEERFNGFGTIAGTRYRDVTVKLYGEDTAITRSNYYEYDDLLFDDYSHSWTKLNGTWYSNSNCNTRS